MRKRIVELGVTGTLLLSVFFPRNGFAGSEALGKVMFVSGKAFRMSGNVQSDLKKGSPLSSGDLIQTEAGSHVIAKLGNSVVTMIKPSSRLFIHQENGKDWMFQLEWGSLLS